MAEGHAYARFQERDDRHRPKCAAAEDAARELQLSLHDALQLVHLYADRRSPKFERAALRWLERYLAESSPRLQGVAEVTASLARRQHETGEPT